MDRGSRTCCLRNEKGETICENDSPVSSQGRLATSTSRCCRTHFGRDGRCVDFSDVKDLAAGVLFRYDLLQELSSGCEE